MNDVEKYQRSLSFWQMGFYFLNISNAVFKQTIKSGNAWIVIDDEPMTFHVVKIELDNKTEMGYKAIEQMSKLELI